MLSVMSKEQDALVSGVMFLVAIKSFEAITELSVKQMVGVCSPELRFTNSLLLAVLVAAGVLSTLISFIYFKAFSQKICEPFLGGSEDEEE